MVLSHYDSTIKIVLASVIIIVIVLWFSFIMPLERIHRAPALSSDQPEATVSIHQATNQMADRRINKSIIRLAAD